MRVVHIMFCGVSDRAEVNTGCNPLGVPRGSGVIQNGRWAFLPVHTWSLPSHAEPLGLPLFSGPSSPLLSVQRSNGVGNIRVTVANTGLMGIKQTPNPPLPIKHGSKWTTLKGQYAGSVQALVVLLLCELLVKYHISSVLAVNLYNTKILVILILI